MIRRKYLNKTVRFGTVVTMVSISFLSGCTAMASNDQLQALEESKKAAEAAEADLNACRQQRAELDRQLAQTKDQLAQLKSDREVVQKALQQ